MYKIIKIFVLIFFSIIATLSFIYIYENKIGDSYLVLTGFFLSLFICWSIWWSADIHAHEPDFLEASKQVKYWRVWRPFLSRFINYLQNRKSKDN